jgi:hypothetical protein
MDAPRSPRTSRDDVLQRAVRWRLFQRSELPARLRRLERLERAADAERELERGLPKDAG